MCVWVGCNQYCFIYPAGVQIYPPGGELCPVFENAYWDTAVNSLRFCSLNTPSVHVDGYWFFLGKEFYVGSYLFQPMEMVTPLSPRFHCVCWFVWGFFENSAVSLNGTL